MSQSLSVLELRELVSQQQARLTPDDSYSVVPKISSGLKQNDEEHAQQAKEHEHTASTLHAKDDDNDDDHTAPAPHAKDGDDDAHTALAPHVKDDDDDDDDNGRAVKLQEKENYKAKASEITF